MRSMQQTYNSVAIKIRSLNDQLRRQATEKSVSNTKLLAIKRVFYLFLSFF